MGLGDGRGEVDRWETVWVVIVEFVFLLGRWWICTRFLLSLLRRGWSLGPWHGTFEIFEIDCVFV